MSNMKIISIQALSIALSVVITFICISFTQTKIVQVDPKLLIDSYRAELDKSSYTVTEQADRLVQFTQILESKLNQYGGDNNAVILVGPAVASHEIDVTKDISELIIDHYKQMHQEEAK